jgi:hypothetical protein
MSWLSCAFHASQQAWIRHLNRRFHPWHPPLLFSPQARERELLRKPLLLLHVYERVVLEPMSGLFMPTLVYRIQHMARTEQVRACVRVCVCVCVCVCRMRGA